MSRCVTSLLFAAAAGILLSPLDSWAQGRNAGGFGSGSGFGQSSFGSSASFGSSSFGSSASGGSGFGQSSFGSSGFGAGATGATQSGFGGTTGAQTPFVGRGAADLEAFFGGINQAFESAQRSQRSRNRSSGSGEAAGRRPEVRVKLTASPELVQSSRRRQTNANRPVDRAARLIARKGLADVVVSGTDGAVTLTGAVRSESDRLLAEKLLAIEPGVRRIDNRLVVSTNQETLPSPR